MQQTDPDLQFAKKNHIKTLSYPEALGELTKTHYTIAVSGTHGKSTTTAMLGLLLIKAGLNPTVIVGTKLKEFDDSNCRVGGYPDTKYQIQDTRYLVIEADEHFASFLNYWPKMIVLTTIEADHLDYYKNLGNIIKTFKKYLSLLPKDGLLVANRDDKNTRKIVNTKYKIPDTKYYSLKQREAQKLRKILRIPGEHNVSNALAALAVARILKIPDEVSFKALSEYRGSWRRFEEFKLTINNKQVTLISDYGHHPTEVRVTVEAARQKWPLDPARGKPKKIWLVFQPHQYARTYYLWNDFVKVLSRLPVDKLIITDIFDVAGREETEIKKKVSSERLVRGILNTRYKIPDTLYIPTIQQVYSYLQKNLRGGEIVIVMGAGDIYSLALRLTKVLDDRQWEKRSNFNNITHSIT